MSARPDTYRKETERWLQDHGLSHYTLLMRRGDDRRVDEQVKAEMFAQHFPDQSVVHSIIDDRPRVIRMWRERGLEVTDVGAGVEF